MAHGESGGGGGARTGGVSNDATEGGCGQIPFNIIMADDCVESSAHSKPPPDGAKKSVGVTLSLVTISFAPQAPDKFGGVTEAMQKGGYPNVCTDGGFHNSRLVMLMMDSH